MDEKEKNIPKKRGRPPKSLTPQASTKTCEAKKREKLPKVKVEFPELAKTKSVDALERLMSVAKDSGTKPEAIIKACETVIAYGYGKPGQNEENSDVKVEVDYD